VVQELASRDYYDAATEYRHQQVPGGIRRAPMGAIRAVPAISDVRRLELGWGRSVVGELAGNDSAGCLVTVVLAIDVLNAGQPAVGRLSMPRCA
jgi:hypothetical protein